MLCGICGDPEAVGVADRRWELPHVGPYGKGCSSGMPLSEWILCAMSRSSVGRRVRRDFGREQVGVACPDARVFVCQGASFGLGFSVVFSGVSLSTMPRHE